MNEKMFFQTRLYFTGIVSLAIWALLAWNHFHGGVPSHHILHREDLPSISNWWGGLVLPFLSYFLLHRIQKRIIRYSNGKSETSKYPVSILYGFVGALFFGIMISSFFTLGYSDFTGFMFMGLLILALLFPIYRAECLLGFVIGMTYTFGVLLPTVFGSLIALVGVMLFLVVRPVFLYIGSRLMNISSFNKTT